MTSVLDSSGLPLISKVEVVAHAGYDQVFVWARGGLSGDLKVWSGDGQGVADRLLPGEDRVVSGMVAAVKHMRRETIEEVLQIVRTICPGGDLTALLVDEISALLPPDSDTDPDAPIPYAITAAGEAALNTAIEDTEPPPPTLPSGEVTP